MDFQVSHGRGCVLQQDLGDSELMGIYLRGTSLDELVSQVTCGNVGLAGAVEIPEQHFPGDGKAVELAFDLGKQPTHRFLSFVSGWSRLSQIVFEEEPIIARKSSEVRIVLECRF